MPAEAVDENQAPIVSQPRKNNVRKLNLHNGSLSSETAGVKLTTRKLSFDSHVSKLNVERERKKEEDGGSPEGIREGLPSLLKRLRHDAQQEIERATASVTQMHLCMALEIRLLEQTQCEMMEAHRQREASSAAAHQQQTDTLHAQIKQQADTLNARIEELRDTGELLRSEKRDADVARAATVRTACCLRRARASRGLRREAALRSAQAGTRGTHARTGRARARASASVRRTRFWRPTWHVVDARAETRRRRRVTRR